MILIEKKNLENIIAIQPKWTFKSNKIDNPNKFYTFSVRVIILFIFGQNYLINNLIFFSSKSISYWFTPESLRFFLLHQLEQIAFFFFEEKSYWTKQKEIVNFIHETNGKKRNGRIRGTGVKKKKQKTKSK